MRLAAVAGWSIVTSMLIAGAAVGQVDPFKRKAGASGGPAGPVGGVKAVDAGNTPGVIANAEFVDTPITSIFKMISDLTGWSILMSPTVSDKPPKINIWIKNLTPDQVLEQVGMLGRLVVQRQGNAVQVMSYDEYTKTYGVEKKVMALKNGSAKDIATLLQPFAEKDQTRILADAASNQIVLLVPAQQMESLEHLVEQLDVPFAKDTVVVIKLEHLEANVLSRTLDEFLAQEARSTSGSRGAFGGQNQPTRPMVEAGGGGTAGPAGDSQRAGQTWLVRFMIEPKLNAIVLRGLEADVSRAVELIKQLDVETNLQVRGYQLRYTNAREVYDTLNDIISSDLKTRTATASSDDRPRIRVSRSEQNNRILVEGSAADHARIAALIEAIDQPLPAGSGGIRVYRLENATSKEVVAVLRDIIEQRGTADKLARQERVLGDNTAAARALHRAEASGIAPVPNGGISAASPGPPTAQASATLNTQVPSAGDVLPVHVTEAPDINAVVIKASAADQEEFEAMIRDMDKPRDQVMLEITLVTVRATDDFNFGIQLSASHENKTLAFTNFGVQTVNPNTGAFSIKNPAPFGLNMGVFNAGDFNMVLNALRSTGETRITSVPKVLIQDNAKGEIRQIDQEPYEVTSQGTNSVLTSFGGFVEAGTTMTVTPHISRDEWLRLEYEVTLSSFGSRTNEQLAANLPPPKRESKSHGIVRVPTEDMIVLGGLAGTRTDDILERVPFIGDVPVLGELFKNRINNKLRETLFIFIRPVVLRDPAFKDLALLSGDDIQRARVDREPPTNPIKLLTPADLPTSKEKTE